MLNLRIGGGGGVRLGGGLCLIDCGLTSLDLRHI